MRRPPCRAGLPPLLLLLPLLALPSCRERPPAAARLPAERVCRWEEAGRLALGAGDAGRALDLFAAASAARERRGEPCWQASDHNFAGLALRRLRRPAEARRQFELAARLAGASHFPAAAAAAANNLALLAEDAGDLAAARRGYRRALDLLAAAGGAAGEAGGRAGGGAAGEAALYRENLARLLITEGDLEEAERLLRPAAGERPAASALAELAWLQLLRQQPGPALASLDRALALAPDGFTEAVVHDRRGTALERLGRPAEARRAYGEALRLAAGRPSTRAATLASLCRLEVLHPAPAAAGEDACAAAVRAAAAPGVPPAMLASSHYWQARRWRQEGRQREAQRAARTAAQLVGRLGADASTPEGAARFLEARAAYWSLAIELSMEIDRRAPGRGFDREALADSELWRARLLIDRLGRSGALAAEPFELGALQAALGEQTCAFSLVLGEEGSFLWRVRAEAVDSYRLPAAAAVEQLARSYLGLLEAASEAPRRGAALEAGSALAGTLFGPRLERLAGCRRLVFVGDGALAPFPLAALPTPPSTPDEPCFLVEQLEIVQLPSLGLLAALRRPRPAGDRPNGGLALIGDPFYDLSLWQDRLRLETLPAAEARLAGGAPAPFPLGRLPFAAAEMRRIAARWRGPGRLLRAAGFAATRERALSAEIATFSIVHFSAHGELGEGPPAIVLSALGSDGRPDPRGGRLLPEDLAGGGWLAELVVASSCESAAGKVSRFEGVGGLAHAFLEAGARRVLASLWKVDGDATAALMDFFYAGLAGRGLAPGEALRAAQLGLLEEARQAGSAWRAPYYWSGFVLIGDWREFSLR